MLTFGSLFAGIGGFDLGLERAGMKCMWQVENDRYANAVLERRWPEVRRYGDAREFPPRGEDCAVDLICGGFPCQDISLIGKQAGIDGDRSRLWYDFSRIVSDIRPRYVLVENVAALLGRGMGVVLGHLSTLGYDAEWHVIPACAVGAPHKRDRVWIVAYTSGTRLEGHAGDGEAGGEPRRLEAEACGSARESRVREGGGSEGWWKSEPSICRVAHGVPSRMDRIRCLGNAVVPQVAEFIGRAIIDFDMKATEQHKP